MFSRLRRTFTTHPWRFFFASASVIVGVYVVAISMMFWAYGLPRWGRVTIVFSLFAVFLIGAAGLVASGHYAGQNRK